MRGSKASAAASQRRASSILASGVEVVAGGIVQVEIGHGAGQGGGVRQPGQLVRAR